MGEKVNFDYFYGGQSDGFSYYRIPRLLITAPQFKSLSTDAKLLYGLLLDRMGLSSRNGWYDELGRVYIYYSLDEIQRDLNCGHEKAVKLLAELDAAKGIGLIERIRQGQGRPAKIYVKQFTSPDLPKQPEVSPPPAATDPRLPNFGSQDFGISEVLTSEKQTSRLPEIGSADFRKSDGNYNNIIYPYGSYLDPSIHPSQGIPIFPKRGKATLCVCTRTISLTFWIIPLQSTGKWMTTKNCLILSRQTVSTSRLRPVPARAVDWNCCPVIDGMTSPNSLISRTHPFLIIQKALPRPGKREENNMQSSRAKNVIRFMIPTMLSNVCFFLFTIVDGIFVGNGVGTNGLGAVNIAMPFTMVTGALFMMINIGSATMVAVRMGRNDTEGANKVFRNGMILLAVVAAILCGLGVFCTDTICRLLGANETFHEMAADYLFWYSVFIIPSGLSMGLQAYCRNDNAPGLVGMTVIVSTALNIFGDWLLIFPIPLGTAGAAIATGISQTVGLLIVLTHFIRKKGILCFGKTEIDGTLWKEIAVHGLPEGIGQLATPIMTLCMNLVLVSKIGDIGVNAFSVISYVASFSVAVFFGTSEGLQPLFGQSYGAKNEADMKFYFKVGIWINFLGSILVSGLILLLSRQICMLFGADAETLEYTLQAMPKFAWGFVMMAFNVMISAYLYSTERSAYATVLNFLRSIVVSVLVIMLLPEIFGADIVWFTFGIYEAVVLVFAVLLLKHSERQGIVFKE